MKMKSTKLIQEDLNKWWRIESWKGVGLAVLLVNLPLLVTYFVSGKTSICPFLLQLYPVQFVFLLIVFPFVTLFTSLCGRKLLAADVPKDGQSALARFYPYAFLSQARNRLLCALAIGLILAVVDHWKTTPAIYQLQPNQVAEAKRIAKLILTEQESAELLEEQKDYRGQHGHPRQQRTRNTGRAFSEQRALFGGGVEPRRNPEHVQG